MSGPVKKQKMSGSETSVTRGMFLSEAMSDMKVVVKDEMNVWTFPVHSFVLKSQSPVFKTMLENEYLETQSMSIVMTDFKAVNVKQFLKAVYTESLPDSVHSLCELVRIADKYLLTRIVESCERALLLDVNIENVCQLCNLAQLYSLQNLKKSCLTLMKRVAFWVLKCDEFEHLSAEVIEDIVSSDELNVISETDVFTALWKWGTVQVCRKSLPISDPAIIAEVRPFLKSVRWNLIQDAAEKLLKFGITLEDSDLQKKNAQRKSIGLDSSLLHLCDVVKLDENSSACIVRPELYKTPGSEVFYLTISTSEDTPFYILGVVISCTGVTDGTQLICRCHTQNTSTVFPLSMSLLFESPPSIRYQDVICQFHTPVKICKNQEVNFSVKSQSSFGGTVLTAKHNIVRSRRGKVIFILQKNIYCLRKIFLL